MSAAPQTATVATERPVKHVHVPETTRRFQRRGETARVVMECGCGHTWVPVWAGATR